MTLTLPDAMSALVKVIAGPGLPICQLLRAVRTASTRLWISSIRFAVLRAAALASLRTAMTNVQHCGLLFGSRAPTPSPRCFKLIQPSVPPSDRFRTRARQRGVVALRRVAMSIFKTDSKQLQRPAIGDSRACRQNARNLVPQCSSHSTRSARTAWMHPTKLSVLSANE